MTGSAGRPIFRRVAKNVGWLTGSRAFAGVVGLGYLAVAARALGRTDFGIFTLVLTYGQLIANLVQFQSWKGVIRYGAAHAAANERGPLARLFGFTATLDWLSAIVGFVLAIVAVPLVAPLLHWNAHEQHSAALFAGVLLLTTGATASGMLRLFDRFDLMAYCEAVAPAARLLGCIIAWALHGGVGSFLIVWAAAAALQMVAQWIAALFIHRAAISVGPRQFARAARENRNILKFMIQTNLANSLGLFWMQLGTLTVGATAGPVQAGGFRIAQRLAKAIAKPVEPITRAIYPELARLVASDEHSTVRSVLLRVSAIAAGLAVVVVIAVALFGRGILALVAGKEYEFAQPLFLLLSIAAALDLASFALEPFHNAHGRAGRVLRSRAVAAVVYLLLLAALVRQGAVGPALAAIGAAVAIFVQLAQSALQILRHKSGESETVIADGTKAR